MHFEDIWNDAEKTAEKFPKDVINKEAIITRMELAVDLLRKANGEMFNLLIGNILYESAALCMLLDKEYKVSVNSAAVLKGVTDDKKIHLLDPSYDDWRKRRMSAMDSLLQEPEPMPSSDSSAQ